MPAAFCCLQVMEEQRWFDPIAGFYKEQDLLAKATVEMLDRMIRHGERGIPAHPRRVLVKLPWRDGPSLFPQKTAQDRVGLGLGNSPSR